MLPIGKSQELTKFLRTKKEFELHSLTNKLLQTQKPVSFLLTDNPASSLNLIPPFLFLGPFRVTKNEEPKNDNGTDLTHKSGFHQGREAKGTTKRESGGGKCSLFFKYRKFGGSYKEVLCPFLSNSSLLVPSGSQKAIF